MIKQREKHITKQTALILLLAVSGACLVTGCKKKEKINASSIHTTAAETMTAEPETEEQTTAMDLESEKEESAKPAAPNIATKKNTYTSGKVSIEYPSVINLSDEEKTDAIDTLLKENALSVIKAYGIDETKDSLEIQCQVLSTGRSRITVVYTGAALADGAPHPTNIFYSNTIDVQKAENLGFEKFADPYTMAGYVLSGDCQFPKASEELKAELMKIKNDCSLEDYTRMFQNADFPFEGDFPSSFSYEHEGNIYFSIPVPHALGDYAIVMYTPDTK